MAFETGTATSYTDLLSRFITFITTNASLVSASENWSVLREVVGSGAERDYLIQGVGHIVNGVNVRPHVRIATQSNVASDIYGITLQGFTSYNSELANDVQPGNQSDVSGMALWNSSIPYWFIANGRRFMIIAKVSTTYSSCYAGFILPYATPAEYPYPMLVAGSHESATTHRWSQADHQVGGFWDPSLGNAYFYHIDGTWLAVANYDNGSGGSRTSLGTNSIWPYEIDLELTTNGDGSLPLLQTVLHSSSYGGNVYGEPDGVFYTSGIGVGSEDTITEGGVTHLIVQSVYRTDRRSYAAIRLE